MRGTLEDRFWVKVRKASDNECWEWTACVHTASGYGRIQIMKAGRWFVEYAHRVSWRLHYGEIPEGLCVCHHCDNPPCVNPHHLFLGAAVDNAADRDRKGRHNAPRGEQHYKAKLTEDQVIEIRERYARGESPTALEKEFEVSLRGLEQVIYGQSWKYL